MNFSRRTARVARPLIMASLLGLSLIALAQCKEKAPVPAGPTPLKYEEISLDPATAAPADKQALETFDRFQKDLQQQLMAAIKKGGPAKAIDVCRTASPDMEKKMSGEATLVRISDKPRNPDHKPAGREGEVLALWASRAKAGQEIGPVVFNDGTGRVVMRPIKIAGELCLKCHGSTEQIDGPTSEALKKAYPSDQAVGYAMNDLRGAFVARFKTAK